MYEVLLYDVSFIQINYTKTLLYKVTKLEELAKKTTHNEWYYTSTVFQMKRNTIFQFKSYKFVQNLNSWLVRHKRDSNLQNFIYKYREDTRQS